ncbi:SpoIIE family protein phosphatase [Streptomyces sp. SYSU K217416]
MSARTDLFDVDQVSAHGALLVLDGVGRVLMCEGAVQTLTGCRPEEVRGRHVSRLPIGVDIRDGRLTGALAPGGKQRKELRRDDGSVVPVHVEVRRLQAAAGAGYLVEILPDLVAVRREENTALVRALFQQTRVGLAIHDMELSTTRLNLTPESLGPPSIAGVPVRPLGKGVEQVLLPGDAAAVREQLQRVADTGEPLVDWVHRARRRDAPELERVLSFSAFRLENAEARPIGVAVVFTDVTDEHVARERMHVLQSAAERIGGELDMGRIAEELADALVGLGFADLAAVDLTEAVLLGEEPSDFRLGAPLRRVGVAAFDGRWPAELHPLAASFRVPPHEGRNLVGTVPVFRSDLGEWRKTLADDPERARLLLPDGATSFLVAPLVARGHVLGALSLWRTDRHPPFGQSDADLVQEIASRAALGLDNARRYTREQRTAEALQRSLLPRSVSVTSAAETAGQYVPAATTAGMGGTWFDVIPLSSARVALVMGEVAGHGLVASATMGRLRTAVQTLADLDLPPTELLTHLDDLAVRLGEAEPGPAAPEPVSSTGFGAAAAPTGHLATGATCLYCVYDPVEGCLEMASAGHPPPLYVAPGQDAVDVALKPGPALGVGGMPFEQVTVEMPPGSLVALFNQPLLAGDDGDDEEALRGALAVTLNESVARRHTAAEAGNRALVVMLPRLPAEDVSLLVARTRRLPTDAVASYEFPADPAVVARARRLVEDRLASWDLHHLVFSTELIISELVTNAIRYGGDGPVGLRLIKDAVLICEVSDTSQTQPRLRRARLTDEGGRGLFLVAQLALRWGSRYTEQGKTLWTEQLLAEDPTGDGAV